VDGFTNKVSRDKVTQQPEVYRMGLQYMGPFGSTILFNSSYQQFYIKDQVCYNKLSAKYVTLDLLVAFRTLDTSSFRMHYGPDFDF
jgi:nitrate/nitrite transporter NarK